MTWAEIDTRGLERIATAVAWSLRHAGGYAVSWPAGLVSLEITADPPLPEAVDEPWWPDGLPGIPIGVTDTDHADGVVDTVDALTGEVLASWPVLLVHPGDSQRHYLVVGGTGAGKSNFTRGFIARALRLGWFPGGCFISMVRRAVTTSCSSIARAFMVWRGNQRNGNSTWRVCRR